MPEKKAPKTISPNGENNYTAKQCKKKPLFLPPKAVLKNITAIGSKNDNLAV